MEQALSNGTLWKAIVAILLFVAFSGTAVGQPSEQLRPLDRVATSGHAGAAISRETSFHVDRLGENVLTTEDPRQRERALGALLEIVRKLEEYDIAMEDPILEGRRALSRLEVAVLKDKALSFCWEAYKKAIKQGDNDIPFKVNRSTASEALARQWMRTDIKATSPKIREALLRLTASSDYSERTRQLFSRIALHCLKNDNNAEVRKAAIAALGRYDLITEEVKRDLTNALAEPAFELTAIDAIQALREKAHDLVPTLQKHLVDSANFDAMAASLRALNKLDGDSPKSRSIALDILLDSEIAKDFRDPSPSGVKPMPCSNRHAGLPTGVTEEQAFIMELARKAF